MKSIYISPYFLIVLIFAYITNNICEYSLIFLIALIHEIFHLIFAVILGYKVSLLKIMPYGACLEINNDFRTASDELMVSAAGPFSNLLMLLFCIYLKHYFDMDTSFFAYANIYMMIINMIPAFPLDGGRIFKCLTKDILNHDYMYIYRFLTVMSAFSIFSLGLYLAIKTRENFSLVIIGIFMINHTDISNNKSEKICKLFYGDNICYKPGFLVLNEELLVNECMHLIKMDNLIVIFLINNDKKIVKTITNIQIINQFMQGKIYLELKDI